MNYDKPHRWKDFKDFTYPEVSSVKFNFENVDDYNLIVSMRKAYQEHLLSIEEHSRYKPLKENYKIAFQNLKDFEDTSFLKRMFIKNKNTIESDLRKVFYDADKALNDFEKEYKSHFPIHIKCENVHFKNLSFFNDNVFFGSEHKNERTVRSASGMYMTPAITDEYAIFRITRNTEILYIKEKQG